MERAKAKLQRWGGHAVRFIGNEAFINWGTGLMTFGAVSAVMTGGITTPLLLAGAGGGMAAAGAVGEWKMGGQDAPSETEKKIFKIGKVAQIAGTGALTGLAILTAPASAPIAAGLGAAAFGTYAFGAVMGARAIAHRK